MILKSSEVWSDFGKGFGLRTFEHLLIKAKKFKDVCNNLKGKEKVIFDFTSVEID